MIRFFGTSLCNTYVYTILDAVVILTIEIAAIEHRVIILQSVSSRCTLKLSCMKCSWNHSMIFLIFIWTYWCLRSYWISFLRFCKEKLRHELGISLEDALIPYDFLSSTIVQTISFKLSKKVQNHWITNGFMSKVSTNQWDSFSQQQKLWDIINLRYTITMDVSNSSLTIVSNFNSSAILESVPYLCKRLRVAFRSRSDIMSIFEVLMTDSQLKLNCSSVFKFLYWTTESCFQSHIFLKLILKTENKKRPRRNVSSIRHRCRFVIWLVKTSFSLLTLSFDSCCRQNSVLKVLLFLRMTLIMCKNEHPYHWCP